ncbi:MAG: chemotaxis protein CheW [Rickettsiales bacterium]|jgi:purine-binding chemotaxis protein CheW
MSASPTLNIESAVDAVLGVESQMYVTMRIDRQLFGIPVRNVRDVLRQQKITSIPLSSSEIAGSLNLRGRIVTVINLRRRLNLTEIKDDEKGMFVVVEHKGELFSLIVDSVGEVMTVPNHAIEKSPTNLGGAWREVTTGVYKLSGELLVIIDVQTMLTMN